MRTLSKTETKQQNKMNNYPQDSEDYQNAMDERDYTQAVFVLESSGYFNRSEAELFVSSEADANHSTREALED